MCVTVNACMSMTKSTEEITRTDSLCSMLLLLCIRSTK